jgi:class 3 adenylate cyclase
MRAPDFTPQLLPSTTAITWLLNEASSASEPGILLRELCNRLAEEALPISGALLSITSLDPLIAGRRLRWQGGNGRVLEEVLFHGMTAVEDPPASNAALEIVIAGTSHKIEWLAGSSEVFTTEQASYLAAVSLAMAAPLQVVVGREINRSLLRAYLGRRSADKVLAGTVRRGSGEMIEAVVWVSDLRDFTILSETQPPEQVIAALNDCCARLVGAIHPFRGEVLKFIGDGLLAIFPLAPQGTEAACTAALSAVRAAREGMVRLNRQRVNAGLPTLSFGVALHLGAVMYGNIGAPDRVDFTAIGPAVNITSRIEGLCRQLQCPVLISEAIAAHCGQRLKPIGLHSIRGISQPVSLFTLPDLSSAV